MTKLMRLISWRARMALAVVVNDGLWQSSMIGVIIKLAIFVTKVVVHNDSQ